MKNNIKSYKKSIQHEYNITIVKIVNFFVKKYIKKMYENIFFIQKDIDFNDNPVVFVLNHQSHLDYLLSNHLFFEKFLNKKVLIAAGENLNFFPIGDVLRSSGAFYIKRTFNEKQYKKEFHAYLLEIMHSENIIEFFIEGSRSRYGQVTKPKLGFLKMLKESNKKINIIPFSLHHSFIFEQKSFVRENNNKNKNKENFLNLIKNIFSRKKLGNFSLTQGKTIYLTPESNLEEKSLEIYTELNMNKSITTIDLVCSLLAFQEQVSLDVLEKKFHTFLFIFKIMKYNVLGDLSLHLALEFLIKSKKITIKENHIKVQDQHSMQYNYNSFFHYFLGPSLLGHIIVLWEKKLITSFYEIKKYVFFKRKEVEHLFYVPSFKELLSQGFFLFELLKGRKDLHMISDHLKQFFSYFYQSFDKSQDEMLLDQKNYKMHWNNLTNKNKKYYSELSLK